MIKNYKEYVNSVNESYNTAKEVTNIISSNMHNYLVNIVDNAEDNDIIEHGEMLSDQLNTAGGSHIMKDEVVSFIYKHRYLIPELVGKLRNVTIDNILE